jgi:glycosyltransferase involved in cell wall biosynthesis
MNTDTPIYKFSIITPTYNRAKYLPNIYGCLLSQDSHDFEWIIVDDGSTDDTQNVVAGLGNELNIEYIYQKNAGKPSAVNAGVAKANSYITIILDSDDVLLSNALEIAWKYFDENDKCFLNNCVSLSGLSMNNDNMIIGDLFPSNEFVSDHISCRYNRNINGDKCDFFLTPILKKYPFPLFEGENFITEAAVWNRIAFEHNVLYINNVFQIKDYLPEGLSSRYDKIMLDNPQGSELFFNEASNKKFNFQLQLHHSVEYIKFAKINRRKYVFKNAKNKQIYFLGLVLYHFKYSICLTHKRDKRVFSEQP